jgi:hypothetical protein
MTFNSYLLFTTSTHTCLRSGFLSLGFRTRKYITITPTTNVHRLLIFLRVIAINQPFRRLLNLSSYAVTTGRHCQRFEISSCLHVMKTMILWPSETLVTKHQSTWRNKLTDLNIQHNRWKNLRSPTLCLMSDFQFPTKIQTIWYIEAHRKRYFTAPSCVNN